MNSLIRTIFCLQTIATPPPPSFHRNKWPIVFKFLSNCLLVPCPYQHKLFHKLFFAQILILVVAQNAECFWLYCRSGELFNFPFTLMKWEIPLVTLWKVFLHCSCICHVVSNIRASLVFWYSDFWSGAASFYLILNTLRSISGTIVHGSLFSYVCSLMFRNLGWETFYSPVLQLPRKPKFKRTCDLLKLIKHLLSYVLDQSSVISIMIIFLSFWCL